MNVLGYITRTHMVVGALDSVLCDNDGGTRICTHGPFKRIIETLRNIGNITIVAQVGIFWKAGIGKQLGSFTDIEVNSID